MATQLEKKLEKEFRLKDKAFEKAQDTYHQAEVERNNAYRTWMRSTKCTRCGASPGGYVCADADRVSFACTNYVGD